jgi:zinc protease
VPAHPVPPRLRPAEPEPVAARTVELRDPDVHQPSWSREYLAPSYRQGETAQAYPLQVLAEIVGGGATSRLYKSLVVEQKVASSADAGYNPTTLGLGTFAVEASPNPGVPVEKLQQATLDLIKDLTDKGVTEQEVTRAKARLQANLAYARDSLHTGANVLGSALATGQSVADEEAWPQRIAAVTPDQVNAAARAVLKDERSVTGLLLPAQPGPNGEPAEPRASRSSGAMGGGLR